MAIGEIGDSWDIYILKCVSFYHKLGMFVKIFINILADNFYLSSLQHVFRKHVEDKH